MGARSSLNIDPVPSVRTGEGSLDHARVALMKHGQSAPRTRRARLLFVICALGCGVLISASAPMADAVDPSHQVAIALSGSAVTLKAGKTIETSVDLDSTQGCIAYTYTTSAVPEGRNAYIRLLLRAGGDSHYSVMTRVTPGGHDYLQLERVVAGKTTILKQAPLGQIDQTQPKTVRFSVIDTDGSPNLTASFTAEGSTTTVQTTDNAADKLTTGTLAGISSYLQSGTTGSPSIDYSEVSASAHLDGAASNPKGWGTPVFHDEFSGSEVDTSLWRVRHNDYMSYDWAVIRSENATVGGGSLNLTTDRLSTPVSYGDGRERTHSAAYLETVGKFSQAYGRYEVRAKLPTIKGASRGIWPAFWLRPADGGDGELDIMEAYGTDHGRAFDTSYRTEGTVHYSYTEDPDTPRKRSEWTPTGIDVNDGDFHTWALEHTPTSATWFVDGKQYFRIDASTDPRWEKTFGSGRQFDIRLNVQVGSDYWGRPDAHTAAHTDYQVDYVRAWAYQS